MKFIVRILLIYVLAATLLACDAGTKESMNKIEQYKGQYGKQIQQIEELKQGMLEYMESAEGGYKRRDVEACETILIDFIEYMDKTTTQEEGMLVVKSTVIKLNDLNTKCEHGLIETMEREQIAEIIISTGHQKGYNSPTEDITEAWREW